MQLLGFLRGKLSQPFHLASQTECFIHTTMIRCSGLVWRIEKYKKKERGRGGKLRWSRWAMGGCQSKQCQTQTCSHSSPLSFLEIDKWLVTGGQTPWGVAEVKIHSFNHYWVIWQAAFSLMPKKRAFRFSFGCQLHQNISLFKCFCLYSFQRHTRTPFI